MASKATPKRLNTAARPSDQKATKSASDDSSFTLVSYQKKHGATSRVTRASTKNEPNDREFQEATIGHFKKFQEKIFPILEQIFNCMKPQEHPFHTRWARVQQGTLKMDTSSTFRSVAKALDLRDLNDY
jgi:hypothetical protein